MPATARTPLADLPAIVTGTHTLTEQPLSGKLNLRGNPRDAAFLGAVEQTLVALPAQANTVTRRQSIMASWLGPDEWLITTPLDQVANHAAQLRSALAQILATATPLDLRAHAFAPGQCAQTRLGHAGILLWAIDDTPTYDIQIRWSFAQYLFDLLARGIADCEAMATLANR